MNENMPGFLITCDGGGSHASRVAAVAVFVRPRKGQWLTVPPETPGRSGISEVDAVRYVDNPSQEILASSNAPVTVESLVENPSTPQRRRYRLECVLCRKRRTPNTLVISGPKLSGILDKFHDFGITRMTLDKIRAIVSSS